MGECVRGWVGGLGDDQDNISLLNWVAGWENEKENGKSGHEVTGPATTAIISRSRDIASLW